MMNDLSMFPANLVAVEYLRQMMHRKEMRRCYTQSQRYRDRHWQCYCETHSTCNPPKQTTGPEILQFSRAVKATEWCFRKPNAVVLHKLQLKAFDIRVLTDREKGLLGEVNDSTRKIAGYKAFEMFGRNLHVLYSVCEYTKQIQQFRAYWA